MGKKSDSIMEKRKKQGKENVSELVEKSRRTYGEKKKSYKKKERY